MIPLRKPDSDDPRPIAVGLVFRRLASKIAVKYGITASRSRFAGSQVGVGVKNGAEAIVHSLRYLLANNLITDEMVVGLVDFKNAFNCIDRTALLKEIASRYPAIYPYVKWCLAGNSHIYLYDGSPLCPCTSGVQQGDPLGPLLFAIVQQILEKIKDNFPNLLGDPLGPLLFAIVQQILVEKIKANFPNLLLNVWYLDDGTLVGTKSDVLQVLQLIQSEGPPLGLHLNASKTVVWSPSIPIETLASEFVGLAAPAGNGFKTLGSYFGSPEECDILCQKRVSKIRETIEAINQFENLHTRYYLLKMCGIYPRINYIMRTCPADLLPSSFVQLDSLLVESITNLLPNVDLTAWHWKRIHNSVNFGGLQLPSIACASPAAYTGSSFDSINLQAKLLKLEPPLVLHHFRSSILPRFMSLVAPEVIATISLPSGKAPQYLTGKLAQKALQDLLQVVDPQVSAYERKVLLTQSSGVKGTAAILHVAPVASSFHDHRLPNDVFLITIKQLLGLPVYTFEDKCHCCNAILDIYGVHASSCAGGSFTASRKHNGIRDRIHKLGIDAGLQLEREVLHLLPGSNERPADIFGHNLLDGKNVAYDVVVASSCGSSGLWENYNTKDVINEAITEKNKSYLAKCAARSIKFIPLVFLSLGGHSDSFETLITLLANRYAEKKRVTVSAASIHIRAEVAVSVANSQGMSILYRGYKSHCLPSFFNASDDSNFSNIFNTYVPAVLNSPSPLSQSTSLASLFI